MADSIGENAGTKSLAEFLEKNSMFLGGLVIPGIDKPLIVTADLLQSIAEKYLYPIQEGGKIYRHIVKQRGNGNFFTEVSMDETAEPQTPIEMLFILAAMAGENIPAQTIAPKFSGRFNKGVDCIGDVGQFRQEFEEDLCVVKYGVKSFGLPKNRKLSVHSGSDKFSIYQPIRELIQKHDAGIHVKNALPMPQLLILIEMLCQKQVRYKTGQAGNMSGPCVMTRHVLIMILIFASSFM